jgi:hypothetical protein
LKAKIILTLGLILAAAPSWAQKVEITPFYGFQFGDSFLVSRGEVSYKSGANWGFTLDVEIEDELKFEFLYSRADTELRFRQNGIGDTRLDMSVQYFHGGILYEVDASDRVRGFFTATAGMAYFTPEPSNVSDEWKFSVAGGAGVKLFMSDHVGIRLQGRLLFPFLGSGSGFVCGLPGGCFVGINAWTTVSGDVTAGLILAF